MSQGAGCTVEEGHAVIKKEARAAGVACQAARGQLGLPAKLPLTACCGQQVGEGTAPCLMCQEPGAAIQVTKPAHWH